MREDIRTLVVGKATGDGGPGLSGLSEEQKLERVSTFMTRARMNVDEVWQQ